ncbi:MAG TPA: choice-of-anchor Q domain-containing protein, partial [Acidimicrobiales bacterium]
MRPRISLGLATLMVGLPLGLGTALLSSSPASAATPVTLYVTSGGTGSTCSQVLPCDLQSAVQSAATDSGDDVSIMVGSGTIIGDSTTNGGVEVTSGDQESSLTIIGNGPTNTTVSPNLTGLSVFWIDASFPVTLEGIEITGGNGADNGGGISDTGTGSLTINNSDITGNSTEYGGAFDANGNGGVGGGIYDPSSVGLTITNSTISDNSTGGGAEGGGGDGGDGGGIYAGGSGTITIAASTISGNFTGNGGDADFDGGSGGSGGGLENAGSGALSITTSTFSDNYTGGGGAPFSGFGGPGGNGGAIYDDGTAGTTTISDSTFSENFTGNGGAAGDATPGSGGSGGAIYEGSNALTVTNSTLFDNSDGNGGANTDGAFTGGSGGSGGAIYDSSGVTGLLTVSFSTLTSNAYGYGGPATGSGTGAKGNSGDGGGIYNGLHLALTATILDNVVPIGPDDNCANLATSDGGYNVTSDLGCDPATGTNSLIISGLNADLKGLAYYGGPTETEALVSTAPFVGSVATGCPTFDQRGVARPTSNCDPGAFDGTGANPYGAYDPELSLPTTGLSGAVSSSVTITATLTINGNAAPANVPVTFSVASGGPDGGLTYSGLTGGGGTADFDLTNNGTSGTDVVSASSPIGDSGGTTVDIVSSSSASTVSVVFGTPTYTVTYDANGG